MGTYYIPRNYRGETRILYIFTVKSLISTALGAIIGAVFLFIFKSLNMYIVGIILLVLFALIGFIAGAIKIPTIVAIPVTKKIGGEPIYEIVLRYFKYKKKRKLYIYSKDVSNTKDVNKEESANEQ